MTELKYGHAGTYLQQNVFVCQSGTEWGYYTVNKESLQIHGSMVLAEALSIDKANSNA